MPVLELLMPAGDFDKMRYAFAYALMLFILGSRVFLSEPVKMDLRN